MCTDDSVGAEVQEGEAISVGRPTEEATIESGEFSLPKGNKILTTPAVRRLAMEHRVSRSCTTHTYSIGLYT